MFPIKDNIPTERFPLVTVALIVINFVAYILAIRHGGSFISGPDPHEVLRFGATPYTITHSGAHIHSGHYLPTWETVLTSIFVHASILHIAGNMLFLWIFGRNVEDEMGRIKFILFYLVGALVAVGLQVAFEPNSTAPTIGAAGAIAAVLGGYVVLFPRAKVHTVVTLPLYFTVIAIPAIAMICVWFGLQAVFAAANLTNPTGSGGGVAYFAHVGGFVFGLLAVRLLARRRAPQPVPPRAPVY